MTDHHCPGESILPSRATGVLRVAIVFLLCAVSASAQAPASPKPAQESAPARKNGSAALRFEVRSIIIEGNAVVSQNEIRPQLLTRETPGWLGKFLHHSISERMGRPDEYFDAGTFAADVERITRYYRNRGFPDVGVDTVLEFDSSALKVDCTFLITEGRQSLIDSLVYTGLVYDPWSVYEELNASPALKSGDPFNLMALEAEVNRVMVILRNSGYPNARYIRDSSHATRYASTGDYHVHLAFQMGKRYRFGPVSVVQEIDSLRSPEPREDITDEIIIDHLDYVPGEYYAADKIQQSQEHLNRLGILDLRSIRESVPAPAETSLTVPTEITYIPRDRNELAPEFILSDESGALNIGAGLGVTRRNFMGGARTANARLRFHTQTIGEFPDYFDPAGESIATVNLTFELLQPYLFSNAVTGIWTFSGIVDKQMAYIQYILRNRLGASGKLATYTTAAFDWTLELTSLTFRPDYVELQKDPEVRLQIEQALLQPRQFNSILGFTLQRDKSNDLFSPSAGFIHSITLEESGVLPVLLQHAIPDLPYTQFYRITTFGRWYIDLSGHRSTVLALKAKAGYEGKYGASLSNDSVRIPQTHLFYGGGSNSVRGWGARQLISGGEPDLGGNLALEGSAEFRFNTFQSARDGLLDKLWLVTFVDVGNVWTNAGDFRIPDLAIAVGIGLRYETFFGPFRLDWGFRIHDPGVPTGQWFTQRQIYGEVIKGGMIHFGIGHAF